ncbi:MAG: transketolase [Planctomycetes bacterium]|nr:transketolase [Planctomycetota bacterium]
MGIGDARREEWQDVARRVARGIRRRVLEHVVRSNGGYLSQACSSAEILATLYTRVLAIGPSAAPPVPLAFPGAPGAGIPRSLSGVAHARSSTGAAYNGPRAPELDRFFFSPVHYALVLYATLVEVGRMALEGLEAFNEDGSTVEMIGAEHSPGIETTAGSLSQALSVAGGVALARKLRREPGRVWVFLSDGEFQEGQTWEAFAALSFHGIDNLGVFADANGQQVDGRMDRVMAVEPLAERLRAFGALVREVDGHDPEALAAAADGIGKGKPLVVLARTDPCRGIAILRSRAPKLHYVRFKDEQERAAYRAALEAF